MKRIIYHHTTSDLPGETEVYREVLVDGSNVIEREKVFDQWRSTADRKVHTIRERIVDPSFAGYDLVQLIERNGLSLHIDPSQSTYVIDEHTGEKLDINFVEMRKVVYDNPRHHWSPAMTSVIASLAGRTNWETPSDQEAA